jgi:hypothetical protein
MFGVNLPFSMSVRRVRDNTHGYVCHRRFAGFESRHRASSVPDQRAGPLVSPSAAGLGLWPSIYENPQNRNLAWFERWLKLASAGD